MSPDLAQVNIAVLSTHGYRAESLALAIAERTGWKAQPFTGLDAGALGGFDTILIDASPGLESDWTWVRAITLGHPDAKVVILGLVESEESVVKLAEAGASGYVVPAASLEDLIAIVQSVHRGEFTCPPHLTYALFSHLAWLAGCGALFLPQSPVLTMRERKVVELLAHNLTNKEIAAHLCISEHTAKNHVQRILKKLGLHDRSLAARSPILRWPGGRRSLAAGAAG